VLYVYCDCGHKVNMRIAILNCRSMVTGDVSTAAKVDVDQVPSVHLAAVDGSGDSCDMALGHQLPLVVRESDLPG